MGRTPDAIASESLHRQGEDVADAALGLDDPRRARIGLQLAPQPQHLNIDAAIEDVFVEPGRLQQILARKRSLRRIEEGQQQGVLAFAQGNRPFLRIGQTPAATIKPSPFPCALQSDLQTGDRATKASEVSDALASTSAP